VVAIEKIVSATLLAFFAVDEILESDAPVSHIFENVSGELRYVSDEALALE
jgi:hypothetical protein